MINVLLVEDKRMSRDSIIGYLKCSGRYQLVADTPNAGMAEMLCMKNHVDLIIMDVCTENNEDGIEATASIKRHFPEIKVIIVTGMTTVDLIDRAKKAGADSFWYKETDSQELITVLDRMMQGERIYPGAAPLVKIGNMLSSEITPTELEVLRLMVCGLSDSAIAETMHVSVSAVRYHVKNLFTKTGYANRVTLIADIINKEFIIPGM